MQAKHKKSGITFWVVTKAGDLSFLLSVDGHQKQVVETEHLNQFYDLDESISTPDELKINSPSLWIDDGEQEENEQAERIAHGVIIESRYHGSKIIKKT